MGHDADIVVVGGGITGAATAWALAQGGSGVLLLEQFALGHTRGSSHGGSRIFRLTYPDPHYVRLAQAALEGWRRLEAESGQTLIVRNGSLDFGSLVSDNTRALASCGVRHELLSGSEVAARWELGAAPDERALFQPDGGVTLADRAHSAFIEAARETGATVAEDAPVTGLALERGAVRVSTRNNEIVARAVVVTAGAWAPALLQPLGIELPVVPTRETVAYFDVPRAANLPPLMDSAIPAAGDYGLARPGQISYSLAAPGIGLKAGLHHAGHVANPDEDGSPDPAIVEWVGDWVGRRYPGATPSVTEPETCLYTNTSDESFVLERHGRVVVGSACSGHGFKFAPVLGRTLAAMARDAAG
jgi:sarcosine oxidase